MNRLTIVAACGAVLMAACEPSPNELLTRGISEFQLGRVEKAREFFERVLDQKPSHPDALFYMGRVCYVEGNYELADYYYHCCLDVDPSYEQARDELEMVAEKLKTEGREPSSGFRIRRP